MLSTRFSAILLIFLFSKCDFVKGYNCSNRENCHCYKDHDDFVAKCFGLKDFPDFSDNVTVIDVSDNKLTTFPAKFPPRLRCLDISENNISIENAETISIPLLTTLKMDRNPLGDGKAARYLFHNLKSLQFLSMKNTNKFNQLKYHRYPANLFQKLDNLKSLHIDGLGGANIGDLFSTNNNLTFLDMSGYERTCNVPIITKGMFKKLGRIRNLSMSYCHLNSIEKGAFKDLHMLEHLDISNNDNLTLLVVPNVTFMINPGIKVLNFDKLQCTIGTSRVFKEEYIRSLTETQLETLSIASNRIAYMEKGVIDAFPKTLKHINAGDNVLISGIYLFYAHRLKRLETLNVSYQFRQHQKFGDFFSTCNDETITHCSQDFMGSATKQIADQGFSDNDDSLQEQDENHRFFDCTYDCNFTFYMPPKLRVLYIHHTHYSVVMNLTVIVSTLDPSTQNKTQLTHMYLNKNFITDFLYPLLGFENLVYVDVSQNLLSNMSGAKQNDCYNLKFLNLSFNFLGNSLENEACEAAFSTLHSLEILDLSTNRITSLAHVLFQSLNNITHLNFSFNKLDEWPIKMEHMKRLEELDLSLNSINVLSKQNMDDLKLLASFNLKKVNLYKNPLTCTCNSFQFLMWLTDPAITSIFQKIHEYKCVLSNNSAVNMGNVSVFVNRMTRECSTYTFAIVGATLFIVLFLVFTTWRVIYRYRWSLRYWYYVSKTTPKRYKNKHHFHFRYDAYISYDEHDACIALQMAEVLEINKKLKCCLPERDFMPGTNIADNIINAIHVSRKIVCIISENYMNSYWSMLELQIGQMDAFHSEFKKNKRTFIAVLMRRNLCVESMGPAILGLLNSNCCVACSSEENVKIVCLEKVAQLLTLDE